MIHSAAGISSWCCTLVPRLLDDTDLSVGNTCCLRASSSYWTVLKTLTPLCLSLHADNPNYSFRLGSNWWCNSVFTDVPLRVLVYCVQGALKWGRALCWLSPGVCQFMYSTMWQAWIWINVTVNWELNVQPEKRLLWPSNLNINMKKKVVNPAIQKQN